MRFRAVLIGVFSLCLTGFLPNQIVWQKKVTGMSAAKINYLTVTQGNKNTSIYLAVDSALYENEINSMLSTRLYSSRNNNINDIYLTQEEPTTIYLATSDGLYLRKGRNQNWQRIYFSSDESARQCLAVLEEKGTIYLGTNDGAYSQSSEEKIWHKIPELSPRSTFRFIRQDAENIYFVSDHEITRFNKGTKETDIILSERNDIGLERLEDHVSDEDVSLQDPSILYFLSNDFVGHQIFAVTKTQILRSIDQGESWDSIFVGNLPLSETTSLIALDQSNPTNSDPKNILKETKLILGTQRGAFLYSLGEWTPMYQGMETNHVNALALDADMTVYAATDSGLFFVPFKQTLPFNNSPGVQARSQNKNDFDPFDGAQAPLRVNPEPSPAMNGWDSRRVDHEPTIRQVHAWAVDYAEVNPQKIKSWRKAAGKKALLPNLNVGLNRDAGELLHWDTGPNPDNIMKGRDYLDWDVSVTWNLGELIWNNDQTSIDSRSKLMVELREDILDQVTRVYFERRRLQNELGNADSVGASLSRDQQLRLDELTALLDAFTGGKFSQEIQESHNYSATQN